MKKLITFFFALSILALLGPGRTFAYQGTFQIDWTPNNGQNISDYYYLSFPDSVSFGQSIIVQSQLWAPQNTGQLQPYTISYSPLITFNGTAMGSGWGPTGFYGISPNILGQWSGGSGYVYNAGWDSNPFAFQFNTTDGNMNNSISTIYGSYPFPAPSSAGTYYLSFGTNAQVAASLQKYSSCGGQSAGQPQFTVCTADYTYSFPIIVLPPPPTATISSAAANNPIPNTIPSGTATTISWTSTNANSCSSTANGLPFFNGTQKFINSISGAAGIAFDSSGNIYVTSDGYVNEFNSSGAYQSQFNGGSTC